MPPRPRGSADAVPRTDAPNLSECGFDFTVESWGAR